jgi:hypothetical protein
MTGVHTREIIAGLGSAAAIAAPLADGVIAEYQEDNTT